MFVASFVGPASTVGLWLRFKQGRIELSRCSCGVSITEDLAKRDCCIGFRTRGFRILGSTILKPKASTSPELPPSFVLQGFDFGFYGFPGLYEGTLTIRGKVALCYRVDCPGIWVLGLRLSAVYRFWKSN